MRERYTWKLSAKERETVIAACLVTLEVATGALQKAEEAYRAHETKRGEFAHTVEDILLRLDEPQEPEP